MTVREWFRVMRRDEWARDASAVVERRTLVDTRPSDGDPTTGLMLTLEDGRAIVESVEAHRRRRARRQIIARIREMLR